MSTAQFYTLLKMYTVPAEACPKTSAVESPTKTVDPLMETDEPYPGNEEM